MSVKHFDCAECGAHGKITFKEGELTSTDVAYCPFCSSDIYEPEEYEDEES